MFHRILSSALCLFAIGTAYAQPDNLEQRLGVMPSDVQEDVLSEIPTSKKALKWSKETKSCLDRGACDTGTVSASVYFLEKIKKVVQDSEDDVVSSPTIHASSSDDYVLEKKVFLDGTKSTVNAPSVRTIFLEESREVSQVSEEEVSQVSEEDVELNPAIEKKSFEDITLEKKLLLERADLITKRILGPGALSSRVVDTVHDILADPIAPPIIIVQSPFVPILSLPVQRVAPSSSSSSSSSSFVSTVRGTLPHFPLRSFRSWLTPPSSWLTPPIQIAPNTTKFINILAQRQETATRGPGSFSCVTTPPNFGGVNDAKFAPKLPLFNATTLSYANSNVPIDSYPTLFR